MSDPIEENEPIARSGASNTVRFGWGLYQHVAAVFAALGLAAVASHIWDIGWRGFLRILIGLWDDTVRPAMTWIAHMTVSVPLGWLHIDFEVPLWARDYLAVGIILATSLVRFLRADKLPLRPLMVIERDDLMSLIVWLPFVVFAWPLTFIFFVLLGAFLVMDSPEPKEVLKGVRIVSPVLYLGLLLAVNYWVL